MLVQQRYGKESEDPQTALEEDTFVLLPWK